MTVAGSWHRPHVSPNRYPSSFPNDTTCPRRDSSKPKVMDPLAYQTFENSPLPPKLRPTTHARIAEGIHSFGQEFLGVPPEEGVSLFSELAAPATADARRAATPTAGAGSPHFELRPKLPGVGIRMTVLRLANGEVGRRQDGGGSHLALMSPVLIQQKASQAGVILDGTQVGM